MTALLRCPCCGGSVNEPHIRVSLDANVATIGARTVKLTPLEAEILHTLVAAYPNVVRYERLIAKVYGAGEGPDRPVNVFHVKKLAMNKALAGTGVSLATVFGTGMMLKIDKSAVAA